MKRCRPGCVACDAAHHWYEETERWRRLWWSADTDRLILLNVLATLLLGTDDALELAA